MSKLMLFDFECACGNTFDDLVRPDEHSAPCPKCGKDAKRQISAPHFDIRMGCDPYGSPTMGDKWARMHQQAKRIDEKRVRDHGPGEWGSPGADIQR